MIEILIVLIALPFGILLFLSVAILIKELWDGLRRKHK